MGRYAQRRRAGGGPNIGSPTCTPVTNPNVEAFDSNSGFQLTDYGTLESPGITGITATIDGAPIGVLSANAIGDGYINVTTDVSLTTGEIIVVSVPAVGPYCATIFTGTVSA